MADAELLTNRLASLTRQSKVWSSSLPIRGEVNISTERMVRNPKRRYSRHCNQSRLNHGRGKHVYSPKNSTRKRRRSREHSPPRDKTAVAANAGHDAVSDAFYNSHTLSDPGTSDAVVRNTDSGDLIEVHCLDLTDEMRSMEAVIDDVKIINMKAEEILSGI